MTRVEELSTQELVDELQRRSLACLIVSLRVEVGDEWRWSVKGSPIMLGACSGVLNIQIQKALEKIDRGGF